jgi:hypothetical protein
VVDLMMHRIALPQLVTIFASVLAIWEFFRGRRHDR